MNISLVSTHGALNFKGTNDRGQSIQLSGNKEACSPMESLLMSAAGCSAIDVELILGKMRQKLEHMEVKVSAKRRKEIEPAIFTEIHFHYELSGEIKEKKAEESIRLSMEKYCSVVLSLNQDIKITHSYEITDS